MSSHSSVEDMCTTILGPATWEVAIPWISSRRSGILVRWTSHCSSNSGLARERKVRQYTPCLSIANPVAGAQKADSLTKIRSDISKAIAEGLGKYIFILYSMNY